MLNKIKNIFIKNKKTNFSIVHEEGVFIKSYGEKITKELNVFYNPAMKLNRDISLLVIKTYFNNIEKNKYNYKKIQFCDPMGASGIRELRFIKTIPQVFEKIVIGDISETAIQNIKKNFKENELSTKKIKLIHQDAINTISKQYWDFIEIDPFGSPAPFLDMACQRSKHNSILSVTATDTAALCGTYPKTCLRRYGISVIKTLYLEEIGLRNLIAHCQVQAAKYNRTLTPMISYTKEHYYKVFFKVEEGRESATNMIKKLKYLNWDSKTQETKILNFEEKGSFGKTYVGPLQNKNFIKDTIENLNLIQDKKKIEKLLNSLNEEINLVGYYNPNKIQKEYKIKISPKYDSIIKNLKKEGFEVSKSHNSRYSIKTNCPSKQFVEIIQKS